MTFLNVFLSNCRRSVIHIIIDSTGITVHRDGEWNARHYGPSKRRTWCKLHVVIDSEEGFIHAETLTPNSTSDGEAVPPLFEQIPEQILKCTGDGAYDIHPVYEAACRFARNT